MTEARPDQASASPATPAAHEGGGWRRRRDELRLLARRHRVGTLVTVALVAALLGVLVGRMTAPGPEAGARAAVESNVVPLVLDADSIWTSGTGGGDPVSDAVIALSRDGDGQLVEDHHERWLEAYDAALTRMAGVDLPPTARPVQRQFMAAVTLSRDAVEVLGRAAVQEDTQAREELIAEVGRLRQRSEQLAQSARASMTDLDGARTDVSPLPDPEELG